MRKVLTAEEMREVDRLTTEKYGIPSILLMENAAHAAARVITERLGGSVRGKSFLILCGKGNNGGDGAALGRILTLQGAKVFTNLFTRVENTKGDANINFNILRRQGSVDYNQWNYFGFEEFEDFDEYRKIFLKYFRLNKVDCIIDAVFGTGLSNQIKGIFANVIDLFANLYVTNKDSNTLPLFIGLDIPSGLNADSGEPVSLDISPNYNEQQRLGIELLGFSAKKISNQAIYNDLTITFTAPKPANVLPPASNFGGELVVANIGSPQELIDDAPSRLFLAEREDARNWLNQTRFSSDSHKTARGRALIVAGSKAMAGAAVLCANAAMRSGVGLVRVATAESARTAVSAHALPEIMVAGLPETKGGAISEAALGEAFGLYEKMNVLAVGSGLSSDDESTQKFVRALVEGRKSAVVVDADGLNSLAPFDLLGSSELPIILTPHQGEFLKLLGTGDKEAIKDRVKAARDFAVKHHVVLVLKGERNLIAAPDGRVVVVPTGNSGLGKAGSGDTLAGIITGFVGQADAMKIDVFETVVAAVYIAGTAGDIAAERFGKRTMLASDVRECLGEAFDSIGSPSS